MDTQSYTICLVIFAIYAFGHHGKSNLLFALWSAILVGNILYHGDMIINLRYQLYQCYIAWIIPEKEVLLVMALIIASLVRFSYSTAQRFLEKEVNGYELMGLNRDRCKRIIETMGYFPYQAFVSSVASKKLTKGSPEYRQYCHEFLQKHEDVLF